MSDNDKLDQNVFDPLSFTWLPNRACSLKCPSCVIPHQAHNDMPQPELYGVMDAVKEKFGGITFWCVLGGDVVDLPNPVEFVREISARDIFYAITSHSGFHTPDMPEQMMKAGLTNWSVSIDSEKRLKTQTGFAAIKRFQELGLQDIHATLTVDKTNHHEILDLVFKLNEQGVWSEITPYIWSKDYHRGAGKQYDFGTGKNYRASKPDIQNLLTQLLALKDEGSTKIHNLREYFEFWQQNYEQEARCRYPWSLVVDNDGHYRTCLHVRGDHISQFSVFDNVSKEALMDAWRKDEAEHCHGCTWNCTFESAMVYKQNESLNDVRKYFNHGGMPARQDGKSLEPWQGFEPNALERDRDDRLAAEAHERKQRRNPHTIINTPKGSAA